MQKAKLFIIVLFVVVVAHTFFIATHELVFWYERFRDVVISVVGLVLSLYYFQKGEKRHALVAACLLILFLAHMIRLAGGGLPC